jgi:hypothetical protein
MRELGWIRAADFQIVKDYLSADQTMAQNHARRMIHERGGYDLAASAGAAVDAHHRPRRDLSRLSPQPDTTAIYCHVCTAYTFLS